MKKKATLTEAEIINNLANEKISNYQVKIDEEVSDTELQDIKQSYPNLVEDYETK